MNEGVEKIKEFLGGGRALYAATMGLDKTPCVHYAELCFEKDGALYFACPKCGRFYGELSMYPAVKLCAFDGASGVELLIGGRPVFTEDEAVIAECLENSPSLREAWGGEPKMIIAWFLADAVCEFTRVKDGEKQVFELGSPENALIGVRIKKDKQLRDRLSAIMAERESAPAEPNGLQKLYDGAVLYFAECAKQVWPRMDVTPIERSAVFDTYDEREKFTLLAKKLVGNASIDKPEDLTYWLNKEQLAQTLREKGLALPQ
ncbi:MAG: hypothetical protein IIT70_07800 [Clostridia bacterium]|nr:hypothetical protein [Clostridia bacterium]MBQ3938943.1 hypothetical protein [Clostridia bacterium]MBQ5488740.1 hypothetical protein [Clostridia bacterium]